MNHVALFTLHVRHIVPSSILVFLCCAAARGDEATKTRFLKEYAESEQKLADWYSHAVISATVTERRKAADPPDVFKVQYRASGRLMRLDADVTGVRETGPFKQRFARVVNPEKGSFTVNWNDATSKYVVGRMTPDHREVAVSITLDCPFARAAHGFFNQTVREVLDEKGCEVERFERIVLDGKSLAKLTTSERKSDGTLIPSYRTFVFDPARHWALTEYTYGIATNGKAAITCQIEYVPSGKDVPLVKSMYRWHQAKDGTRDQETFVEIHSFDRKKVPASDFTLGAFGIGIGGSYSLSTAYWIAAIGVVLLLGGWTLMRKRLKR